MHFTFFLALVYEERSKYRKIFPFACYFSRILCLWSLHYRFSDKLESQYDTLTAQLGGFHENRGERNIAMAITGLCM